MEKTAGIIGLGVLGSAIAQYLLETGYQINGYDVSDDALQKLSRFPNFHTCNSTSEVASSQPISILCLPSAASLEAVMMSLNDAQLNENIASPLLIELSTLPVDAKQIAQDIAIKQSLRIVDSPVSGNRIVALKGGTIYWY